MKLKWVLAGIPLFIFLKAIALQPQTDGLAADFDDNGVVDTTDFFLFADAFGRVPEGAFVHFDLDHNGAIDFDDFFLFVDSFGMTVVEFPLVMATRSFFDPTLENIEPEPGVYGFDFPVKADILSSATYEPARCATYFKDTYTPRMLSERFDLHAGFDIDCCGITYDGIEYNCEDNPPPIISVCDGTVYRIDQENKASIYVECDQEYNGNPWGNIRVVYRHLAEFHQALVDGGEGFRVSVNDTIGIMGKEDANTVHLHFSVRSTSSSRNRHPARLFDPARSPFFAFLDSADIRILENVADSVLIRIAVPGNMVGINRFEFDVEGKAAVVYDAEYVIQTADGSSERDDPGYIEGMEIYAYAYNGYKSACEGWDDDKDEIGTEYPGSAARGEGNYHPIPCEGLYATAALVYDVVLHLDQPIAAGELSEKLYITVADVFGYGVTTKIE